MKPVWPKLKVVLLLIAPAVLPFASARAHPTSTPLWGPTGLGAIPTTDTVPRRHIEAGLGYENVEPNYGPGVDASVRFFPALSGTVGLNRAEVGAGYLREKLRVEDAFFGVFEQTSDAWNVHGKYRLWQSRREYSGVPDAALAAGFHYIDFDADAGHLTTLYLAGSKVLWHSRADEHLLRGHAGVLHQRTSAIDENLTRPFAGVEYRYRNRLVLAADTIPDEKSATRVWSVIARYESPKNWSAQIGYGEFGSVFRDDDHRWFASVAYRFGK
jgi:hypothetical protein